MDFQLVTSYKPRGDQPRAIDELVEGLAAGEKHQEETVRRKRWLAQSTALRFSVLY